MKVVIGQVEEVDSGIAVDELIRQCRTQLNGAQPQAGILWAGVEFDHDRVLAALVAAFPDMPLVGCTTAGEMSTHLGFSDDSLCLMLFAASRLHYAAGCGRALAHDPVQAAMQALEAARAQLPGPETLCLVFCEAVETAHLVVETLGRQVAPGCPVFGGVAAHPWHIETPSAQFIGTAVLRDAVVVLLVHGGVAYRFCLSNSWQPVGKTEVVGRTRGDTILRIGDRSALDFYRYYLGAHSAPALEFPLAVHEPASDQFYIRSPISYDEADGAVKFAIPVPQGTVVQLTEATREHMRENMRQHIAALAQDAAAAWQPAAGLVFSCATRKQILGTQITEELKMLRAHLPAGLPIMGFYSFGEIGPLVPGGGSLLHNCTFVALLIGDAGDRAPLTATAAAPALTPAAEGAKSEADLQRQITFLKRKLRRTEYYLGRLEYNKDLTGALLRKINREINAARREIKRKNQMLHHKLALADEIQQNLLPARPPHSRYFEVAARSIYCSETGGDYYDYLQVPQAPPESLCVAVGDVTGHGVEAALLMTTVRALLRGRLSGGGTLDEVVGEVNRQLTRDVGLSGRFMTLFLLCLMPHARQLTWVRAGHDPALWYDPRDDRLIELKGEGMALGVEAEAAFARHQQAGLAAGQVLLLATDGLWECRNAQGALFGKQPLYELIRRDHAQSADALATDVMAQLDRFRGGQPLEDDVTLVVVKVK